MTTVQPDDVLTMTHHRARSARVLVRLVILGLVLCGLGLAALAAPGRSPFWYSSWGLIIRICSHIGVILGGLFLASAWTWRRMLRRPALVIDDRGLWDNTSTTAIGFIPWEQVSGFRPVSRTGLPWQTEYRDLVAVVWADPRWPWEHMTPEKRKMSEHLTRRGRPLASLSAYTLGMTQHELVNLLLTERRRRWNPGGGREA